MLETQNRTKKLIYIYRGKSVEKKRDKEERDRSQYKLLEEGLEE